MTAPMWRTTPITEEFFEISNFISVPLMICNLTSFKTFCINGLRSQSKIPRRIIGRGAVCSQVPSQLHEFRGLRQKDKPWQTLPRSSSH